MLNSYQYSDSYDELLKLMIRHAKEKEIDRQITEILNGFFEKEISNENRPFSRPERVHLFQSLSKTILADVIEKIDGTQ